MSAEQTIRTEVSGRVAWITLDRPRALNALNVQLTHEVVEAVRAFDRDRGVGAIVIAGSERAFAAGADIREMSERSAIDMSMDDPFGPWNELASVRTPLIAAVSGLALGGGCELAMLCDIILASETATFGQPEINLGVIPGIGGTQRLPRAIGYYQAADMILTGRAMTAAEALAAGLVSRVVPPADLLTVAQGVAQSIAAKSLPAVYAAKLALRASLSTTIEAGLVTERAAFATAFALDDRVEGMAAFVEKRAPRFTHQ